MTENYDALCREHVARDPSAAEAWLTVAQWAYWEADAPVLSDGCFDWLEGVVGRREVGWRGAGDLPAAWARVKECQRSSTLRK